MRIQQNTDVQMNQVQNAESSLEKTARMTAEKSGNNTAVSGANLTGESLISQRQNLARKNAMKIVTDAFDQEKKLDNQMQSIKDRIKELQDDISKMDKEDGECREHLKELQEHYGVDENSEEHKQLERLVVLNNLGKLTQKDLDNMTEYQHKGLYDLSTVRGNEREIDRLKETQMAYVQGYADIKRERSKSQDMLKAQDAAEEIMDSMNSETISLLTEEAVEHIDEEQKEREEEAKEAAEKKREEKKEKAEKLEKEAIREELIENIRDNANSTEVKTAADTKRALARRERAEAEAAVEETPNKVIISDEVTMDDIQEEVNSKITEVINKLSLLSDDVKGATVDDLV